MDTESRQHLEDVKLIDVNSHSLGIAARKTKSGELINAIVIPKNTPIPCSKYKIFHLNKPDVRSLRVNVLEGEAKEAFANVEIGGCIVRGLTPGLPRRAPIQIQLQYERNGRVSVAALDMTHGKMAHAEIQRKSGLTEDAIKRETAFVDSLTIE